MESHVVTWEFSRATQVRLGAPEDRPNDALAALVGLLAECPEVSAARLGVMEVLPEDREAYFTWAIGIDCPAGARGAIEQRALALLRELPPSRLPIAFVPPTARYLARGAVEFYRRAPRRSWLARLFGR
ncbi:MAG: enhanced serine sensitivity protein SseB C-terminal domain-containing protein [Anaeromyxobacteraceae bacterium]